MTGLFPKLRAFLDGLSGVIAQSNGLSLVIESTIKQTTYDKVVGANGHAQYPKKQVIVKMTTERVYEDGKMRLTGWQNTTTYDMHGTLLTEARERLDK
jgi:hypothetical protein